MDDAKLYNWSTKSWEMVPSGDVTKAVADGTHSFEHGIDVPIVGPDGALGTVGSQDIQAAFQNGYRWQTKDDLNAYQNSQNEAIMDQHYGDVHTADAFIGGVVKGGIPGAVPLMQGIASVTGHDPNAITQGVQQLQERHPTADFAGQLAGAVASPITEALGGAAKTAGTSLAANALGTAAETGIGGVASRAVGSALEGAYFGLHDGINEASLGDPGEVAETLMSSVGKGLVFGGAAGPALEGLGKVASPIKNLLSDKLSVLSEASQKMAALSAKGAILPALTAEQRAVAKGVIDNQELRDVLFNQGGKSAVEDLVSQISDSAAQLRTEQKGLMGEFTDTLKGTPKTMQAHIDDALNQAGGDFYTGTSQAFDSWQGSRTALEAEMARNTQGGSIFKQVAEDTEALVDKLKNSGDYASKQKGFELENYLNAQKGSLARDANVPLDHPDFHELVSAGKEQQMAMELRDRATAGIDDVHRTLKNEVRGYADNLTDYMHSQPEFGSAVQRLDEKYTAVDKLRSFVSDRTGNLEKTVLDKLKADPEYAHEFDALMTHFPDTAPVLQSFKKAIEDPLMSQVNLNSIRSAIREAGVKTSGRMGAEDFSKIADMIGSDDVLKKATRLQEIQTALLNDGAGPITKMTRYLQALGRPVPDVFTKLEPHQQGLERVSQLLGSSADQSTIARILSKATRGVVKGSAFGLLAPIIGSAVGHTLFHGPLGIVAGAAGSALARKAFNPVSSLETLTKLQGGIKKSFGVMDKAVQTTVDALTSKDAPRVIAAAGSKLPQGDDKRANYQAKVDHLTKLQDPEQLSKFAEAKFGTSGAAPNITSAIHSQFGKTVSFLTSKLPQDPVGHQGLMGNQSSYVPPDMDLAKFERYHDAATNPVGALQNIASGKATPQDIETLQTLYPSHFQRLQEGVMDAIMKPDIKLSYQQRVQIGSMFGVPTAVSMRPDFVLAMQSNFKNDKGQGPQPSGVKNNPKVAFDPQSQSTDVERVTYS